MKTLETLEQTAKEQLGLLNGSRMFKQYIVQALETYASFPFWFNYKNLTIKLESGKEFYDLPSDFEKFIGKVFVSSSLTNNSTKREIQQEDASAVEAYSADFYLRDRVTTGAPYSFYIDKNKLKVYPISNGNYYLTGRYASNHNAPQVKYDSATNDWFYIDRNTGAEVSDSYTSPLIEEAFYLLRYEIVANYSLDINKDEITWQKALASLEREKARLFKETNNRAGSMRLKGYFA